MPAARLVPAPVREEAGAGEEVHVAQLSHGAVLGDNGPVEPGEHLVKTILTVRLGFWMSGKIENRWLALK